MPVTLRVLVPVVHTDSFSFDDIYKFIQLKYFLKENEFMKYVRKIEIIKRIFSTICYC